MQKPDILYKAADYLRLSKEDGDFSISPGKRESDSISSQRELCERFVRDAADIELVAEFVDGPVKIGLNQKHPTARGALV